MINSLPLSLVQAALNLVETQDVLESCKDCGAVSGSCMHTDNLMKEDNLTALEVPDSGAPEDQLSGEKEEVIINPEYKTFTSRRPY